MLERRTLRRCPVVPPVLRTDLKTLIRILPSRLTTSEKPTRPKFSKRMFVSALHSGSQAKLTTWRLTAIACARRSARILVACLARPNVPARRAGPLYCEGIGCTRAVWPDQDPLDERWKLTGFERTVVGVVKNKSGANHLTDGDFIEACVPIEGPDLDRSALILHTPVIRRRWWALFRVSPQRSTKWSRSRSCGLTPERSRTANEHVHAHRFH